MSFIDPIPKRASYTYPTPALANNLVPAYINTSINNITLSNGAAVVPLQVGDPSLATSSFFSSAPTSFLATRSDASTSTTGNLASTVGGYVTVNPSATTTVSNTGVSGVAVLKPASLTLLNGLYMGMSSAVSVEGDCTVVNVSGLLARSVCGKAGGRLSGANGALRGVVGNGLIVRSPATAFNSCTVARIVGVEGQALDLVGDSSSSGTVTTFAAFLALAPTSGSSLPTALNVTNNAGLFINPQVMHTSTTNNSAIHINGPSSGGTNNMGIWFNTNNTGTAAGIVFGGTRDTSFWRGAANQLLTQGDWSTRHYLCSSTPTIAAGAAAGTAPTISITGTDHGFAVTLTTGNPSATTGTLFTVTWGATWTSSAPQLGLCPGNANAAALSGTSSPYVSAVSTTTMTFTSGSVALPAATQYIWRFTAMR